MRGRPPPPGDEPTAAGSLDDLLREYLPRLRAFVRARITLDLRRRESDSDVVQSVCRELLEERSRFEFQGDAEFRGWLFVTALNKIREKLRFHKSAKRDVRREDVASGGEPHGSGASPSYEALAHERAEILEAALDRLPSGDREVIALARLAGIPVSRIAAEQCRTEAAVRKQLGRALHRLAEELDRLGNDGGG